VHSVRIPQHVIDRVTKRRGREHIFDDLKPASTALLVVDMQNAFLMPGVAHAVVEQAQEIVPNINEIARTIRMTGGIVVWIKTTFTEESLSSWSTFYGMSSPERNAKRIAALTKGSIGHELWADLDVKADDLTVEKTRYSAFTEGSSNLSNVLSARGITSVIVTGTLTNVCCDSTARDAMMLNFKPIMITDGNAAATDDDHNASLAQFYLTFGDIMSTDMVISCLERNAEGHRRAAE